MDNFVRYCQLAYQLAYRCISIRRYKVIASYSYCIIVAYAIWLGVHIFPKYFIYMKILLEAIYLLRNELATHLTTYHVNYHLNLSLLYAKL